MKKFTILFFAFTATSLALLAQDNQNFHGIKFHTNYPIENENLANRKIALTDLYETEQETHSDGGNSVFIALKASSTKVENDALEDQPLIEANGQSNAKEVFVKVYPNPVTHYLTVTNNAGTPVAITIYNSNGMEIFKFENIENTIEIPKQKLGKGNLIYTIVSKGALIQKGAITVE